MIRYYLTYENKILCGNFAESIIYLKDVNSDDDDNVILVSAMELEDLQNDSFVDETTLVPYQFSDLKFNKIIIPIPE